jgi:hypothetical protein
MTTDKATGRKQMHPERLLGRLFSKLAGCAVVACLLLAAGCADRTSPAATTSNGPSAARAENASFAATAEPKSTPSGQQITRDISFDTIKFDMQKDEPFQRKMITPAIEKIGNSKIRIRGYILPSFQQSGLAQFVLVRDNMQCCFGPGAALYDCIVVQMDAGLTTEFTTQPVAVEGLFSIQEVAGPEGKCLAIYHLQADKVQ